MMQNPTGAGGESSECTRSHRPRRPGTAPSPSAQVVGLQVILSIGLCTRAYELPHCLKWGGDFVGGPFRCRITRVLLSLWDVEIASTGVPTSES